jgi:methionyl-tRNA formyltransferase
MKIIFAGTPQFAASALEALLHEHQVVAVLTQPDRPSGRGMQLTASPVKQLALQQGLAVLQPATLKTEQAQRDIAALDADVMVVAAYGLILPQAVLQLPRHGCLNIHASLLPRWRGAAPIQRAILAGDSESGITIMQMDEGLDTGDMLLRRVCAIDATDTGQTLHDKLAELGAACILDVLRQLEQHKLSPVKQDDSAANYAAKLLKSEAQIDWRQDARQIERAVRAYNPFPVCHASLNGVALKVWQAGLCADQQGEPGRVLAVDKHGITVACGQGALRLEVLQRPGGKAQPAAQFLQAMTINTGDHFSVNYNQPPGCRSLTTQWNG